MTVSLWWNLLVLVFTLIGGFYFYVKFIVFRYWDVRGVDYIQPSFPFGNMKEVVFFRRHISELMHDFYTQSTSKYTGFYFLMQPTLIVRDRDLIERIVNTDFDNFIDRFDSVKNTYDPIFLNMYNMCGDKWRCMRNKMSPVFASDKLPMIFSTVHDIGMTLQGYAGQLADENCENVVDIRDLSARYLTDVIASIAFGIEVDSIRDPTVYFRKMGIAMARPSLKINITYMLLYMAPKIVSLLKLQLTEDDIREFMIEIVTRTLKFREKNKISRQDYMQILLQMRNLSSEIKNEDIDEFTKHLNHLSIEECAAQFFLFFYIGYETTSALMSFLLFELAKNREIMKKAQSDIDRALNKHNWKWSLECLNDMTYLSQCITETLRLHPPIGFLSRVCTKDYAVPDSNLVIEKDTNIIISVRGIQRDSERYPNPEKFDPSRFTPEEIAKRPKIDFLAYGAGFRGCFAQELANVKVKMGLAALLAKFDFKVIRPLNDDFKADTIPFILCPEDGIHLRISRRIFDN